MSKIDLIFRNLARFIGMFSVILMVVFGGYSFFFRYEPLRLEMSWKGLIWFITFLVYIILLVLFIYFILFQKPSEVSEKGRRVRIEFYELALYGLGGGLLGGIIGALLEILAELTNELFVSIIRFALFVPLSIKILRSIRDFKSTEMSSGIFGAIIGGVVGSDQGEHIGAIFGGLFGSTLPLLILLIIYWSEKNC